MTANKRGKRLLVRLACMSVVIVLLWPMLPWVSVPKFVVQASPFVAICSSIANRSIVIGTGIGLAITVLIFLRRRWFCRYICPTGLMLEGVARLGLRKTRWWTKCPPLGQYAAILTIAGAFVGYPVLLWMDPLALFSSPFTIQGAADLLSSVLAVAVLGILILSTLLLGLVWCVRVCPLGGVQELLASIKSLFTGRIDAAPAWPNQAQSTIGRMPLARRAFLGGAVGVGLGLWTKQVASAKPVDDIPLRPPGAVEEERFTGLCLRCGNCLRACPAKIIHPDTSRAGLSGLLAPQVSYDGKGYCLEDCSSCTQVCPTGALQALDLEQKCRYIIGEALVDHSICLLTLGKKDCNVCMQACPFEAVEIKWDEERYLAYPLVDFAKCNGCGACEVACPTDPYKAIQVWKPLPKLKTAASKVR